MAFASSTLNTCSSAVKKSSSTKSPRAVSALPMRPAALIFGARPKATEVAVRALCSKPDRFFSD